MYQTALDPRSAALGDRIQAMGWVSGETQFWEEDRQKQRKEIIKDV